MYTFKYSFLFFPHIFSFFHTQTRAHMNNTPSLFIILFSRVKPLQLHLKLALMWEGIRKKGLCVCAMSLHEGVEVSLYQAWGHRNKVTERRWRKKEG